MKKKKTKKKRRRTWGSELVGRSGRPLAAVDGPAVELPPDLGLGVAARQAGQAQVAVDLLLDAAHRQVDRRLAGELGRPDVLPAAAAQTGRRAAGLGHRVEPAAADADAGRGAAGAARGQQVGQVAETAVAAPGVVVEAEGLEALQAREGLRLEVGQLVVVQAVHRGSRVVRLA